MSRGTAIATGAGAAIITGSVMHLVALMSSGETTARHLPVFLGTSLAMSVCIAAAGHLHRALIVPHLPGPLPELASVIPLIFLAAGIGFTSALLTAKLYFIIPVGDIPVENIFHAGGAAGLLMVAVRRGANWFLSRSAGSGTGEETGRGRGDA